MQPEEVANPTSITDPPRLWVAEASGARLLQPADPTFDLPMPGTSGAQAVAVDQAAQQVWVHTSGGLSLADADGNSVQAWAPARLRKAASRLTARADSPHEPTHLAPVPGSTGTG